MAILEIEMRPEEERRLAQDAEREGLSLVEYARRQLFQLPLSDGSHSATPIWKQAAGIGKRIPADQRAKVPHDGSVNYKHYLYGASAQPDPEAE